ncbi:MFS family permease [Alicyclobacillus cycloheptanicus]|uniref:MFS family permease n=2 Tax=Alicyclobacillus cycloheptanicus TaxID=1457 RepID=A0ABT9XH24_9BACL|nr:MFS family permease [Alicyclobacillus cycloheptanicus]
MQTETRHQSNSALLMAVLLMAALLPNILLAPIAGVLVDRWPKRLTMLVTDYVRFALLGLLTLLSTHHWTLPWVLIAFNLLLSAAGTVFRPATVVLQKEIVSNDLLLEANSVQNIGQKTTEILGPAVGGVLIGLFGTTTVFSINAGTFLVSALSLTILRAAEPPRIRGSLKPQALYGDIQAGMRVYLSIPYAKALTPFLLMYNFPIAAIEFLIVKFVANALHDASNHGAFIVGVFNTCLAAGELTGGFFVSRVSRLWPRERLPIICMSITALCVVAIGFLRQPVVIAALFFVSGFFMIITNTAYFTGIQQDTPSAALGRMYALLIALFQGVIPLSQLVFGAAAAVLPVGSLLSTAGGLAFLGACSAWMHPDIRRPPAQTPSALEESMS